MGMMPVISRGYIYQMHVLRNRDKATNRYRYVVGYSDWHDKTEVINKQQRKYLEKLVHQCDRADTKVIVEDLSSKKNGDQAVCGRFILDTRGGVLGGFAKICCDDDVTVSNIEYRYCRVASVGPVLRDMQKNLNQFKATVALSVGDLVREVNRTITEIDSYDDGTRVNRWYKKYIARIRSEMRRLHLTQHTHNSVAKYIATHALPSQRFNLLNTLLTFDSVLVDLMLVHAILNTKKEHMIIALAGGTHITNAAKLLQKLGYELVYASKVEFMSEHNVKKCVGSELINGRFCTKPKAVNLSIVEKYIK